MNIQEEIAKINLRDADAHQRELDVVSKRHVHADKIITRLQQFQIAIPSWALGTGGTRFGRFPTGGEPATLTQKIHDVGILHQLTQSAGAISLHIPWDIPENEADIRQLAADYGIRFDAVNSNTFQDQPGQQYSYKFGSLCHTDSAVRNQAIQHNLNVISIGEKLGSKALTIWLADGSSFPGQRDFRTALKTTIDSVKKIYSELPPDWKLLIEYKPFEPNFYSMVIPDWGTSKLIADHCGDRAFSLVDLGHHLPNTNIEQIVATLSFTGKLGGFHFNDSKFGDDDLTVGAIKPYQLFLIFCELAHLDVNAISWMIDTSHNLKDPLEDLMQSLEAILIAYAQAMLVNTEALKIARDHNDPARAQRILHDAFRTDVRPLVRESRKRAGGAIDPAATFRELGIRDQLIADRGFDKQATGL